MTKRTLLQIAKRVAQTQPDIASDIAAIAEYSRDDEQRDYLTYMEMCRYTREGQHDAALLLHDALYPAQAAMRALSHR